MRAALIVCAAMVFVLSCGSVERAALPTASALVRSASPTVERATFIAGAQGTSLSIAQGTVGRVGDLSIGLVSVRRVDFTDERGVSGTRLEAALSISGQIVTLRAGEQVERQGYSVFAEELRVGGALDAALCAARPGCSGGDAVTLRVIKTGS